MNEMMRSKKKIKMRDAEKAKTSQSKPKCASPVLPKIEREEGEPPNAVISRSQAMQESNENTQSQVTVKIERDEREVAKETNIHSNQKRVFPVQPKIERDVVSVTNVRSKRNRAETSQTKTDGDKSDLNCKRSLGLSCPQHFANSTQKNKDLFGKHEN